MSTITISKKLIKSAIDEKEGVVILSLEKWKAIEARLEDLEMYRSEKLAKEMNLDDFIVQGLTTPIEAVRRVELLLGIQNSYKVAITPNKHDANSLISFLNNQQNTNCNPADDKEVFLELTPKPEKGEFNVKISC